MLRRRVDGTFEVDEWGLDPDLVALVEPVVGLRWRVSVEGGQHVPGAGPALVVHNRRAGLSEPFVVVRAVWLAARRHARPVGAPDVAPVGTLLRHLGGVLDHAGEVAGLLRADQSSPCPSAGSCGRGIGRERCGRRWWRPRSPGRPRSSPPR